MRRWSALIGMLVATVALVAGAGAASSSIAPEDYLGEWTADTSSQGPTAAQIFTIAVSDETATRTASGTNAASFDDYCKSSYPGVPPVTYFTVTTTGSGMFGGCVSGKTGGHLYTWNTDQVWYAHPGTLKGEPVLNGALEIEHAGGPADLYKFRAHHPAVQFLTHVKFTSILKKSSHLAELTTITGAGEMHIVRLPQPCESADFAPVMSGEGALAVKSVKIGGPNVVELDSLTVEPDADQTASGSTFRCDHSDVLRNVAVTVTKSDPAEKDACPVGASGDLWLVDGGSGGSDFVKLAIPKCHVQLALSQAKARKGSHVVVAASLNENGY